MLNILLMIILLIIIIIFIIISVGIRLTIEWKKIDDEIEGCIKILILKKINIHTIEFDDSSEDESSDDEDRDMGEIFELVKPCISHMMTFLKKLLKSIRIERLENHLIIGFSNYADTGEYVGYIWAVLSILNSCIPNSRLTAEPSFKGEVINFKGYANIDISVLKLIKPLIDLLLKKEVRALIKGVLNG